MNKLWLFIIVFILVGGGVIGLRMLSGNEDAWMCDNGLWVKHGNPSDPMPTGLCTENIALPKESQVASTRESESVPPLTKESFINLFFTLINNKEYDSALEYLAANQLPDEEWIKQFSAMTSVKVLRIEKYPSENDYEVYKVTLDVVMDPESANAPIPYYGWDSNPNIRFIPIVSENGAWKIGGIGTGP